MAGFFRARNLLQLAANVLAGEIAAKGGDRATADRLLRAAVAEQDTHWFTEPPPWYFPVRQALGAVLLQAGRAADAEAVYREDLKRNPGNGWSLFGLAQSLRAQGKTDEADQAEANSESVVQSRREARGFAVLKRRGTSPRRWLLACFRDFFGELGARAPSSTRSRSSTRRASSSRPILT